MTTWGAYTSDGRLRSGLALSYSPSTISHTTSSVTVSWTLYGQSKYASNESGSTATPWAISGSHSQSGYGQGWNVGAGGTWVVASGSFTVSTSYTSTVTVSLSGHFTSSYAYPGDTAYVSASITIPKRPIAAPSTPSGCGWARTSDTHHTVSWANTSPTDTSKPYTNLHVQRQTDGGSWVSIATLGVVTSYTDTGTSANHSYRYRVYASNSAGNSGYSYSTTFYTTPTPPGSVAAAKTTAGDITVTWTDLSPYNDTFALWHAANGVWDGSALTTSIANGTGSYTHTAPNPAQTHQYRMTSHVATPSLTSGYSATSNTVQLEAPPNAPTSLAPSGTVADGDNAIVLTWQHNPVDTTAQRKYEVQYQVDGGAFTSMGVTTSTSPTSTVAASGWGANGHTIGWQVRTWGADTTGGSDGTGASPWSATASVTLSSQPTVVVSAPLGARTVDDGVTTASSTTVTSATANFTSDDIGMPISGGSIPAGATVVSVTDSATAVISAAATATASSVSITIDDQVTIAALTVSWGYAQAEGSPQSQWRVKLYDATGATVLETETGTTESTTVMSTQLTDATVYQVGVSVQSAAGLWSTEDVITFDVAYSLPPLPTIVGQWIAGTGSIALTVDCPDPVSPQVPADHLQVWRFDGYDAWVLVADNVTLGSTVTDNIPALRATNTYAVVAVSATPSLNGTTELRRNYSPNPAYRGISGTAAVRTNRALNPNLRSASTYWTDAFGSNTVSVSTVTTGDGPVLDTGQQLNYYRMTFTAVGSSPNPASTGPIYGSTASDGAPVVAGKNTTISMFYRSTSARNVQLVTTFADGTGTVVGSTLTGPSTVIPANTWVRLYNQVLVPAGATRSMTRAYPVGTTPNFVVGDTIDATGALIESDCQMLFDYFDGDSPATTDGTGWVFGWTGTAGASSSTLSGAGEAVGSPRAYSTYSWYGAKVDQVDAYRMLYLGGNPNTTSALIAWLDAGSVVAAAGDYWTARIQARILPGGTPLTFNPRVAIYDGTLNSYATDYTHDLIDVPADGNWYDLPTTSLNACPSGLSTPTARTMIYTNVTGGGSTAPGTIVELRYHDIEKVAGPGLQAGPYFDGSSMSDTRHLYSWAGTPDASVSIDVGKIMVDVDTTPGCHHVWVNAGPGFAQAVCFTTNVDISDDDGIQKALNQYAGRTKPVETMGEQTEQVITLRAVKYDPLVASSVAAETSSLDDISALAKLPAPACVRTPDGMRVFVSTGVPSFGGLGTAKVRTIQWTFVETDYTEPKGS